MTVIPDEVRQPRDYERRLMAKDETYEQAKRRVAGEKRDELWTRIGRRFGDGVSAREAFARSGSPEYELRPLFTDDGVPGGRLAVVERRADGPPRAVGLASSTYQIVSAAAVASIWDELVRHPITGVARSKRGDAFIFEAELPPTVVRGDEVLNRLLVACPVVPGRALRASLHPMRLICLNGMVLPVGGESLRLRHTGDPLGKLRSWFAGLLPRYEGAVRELALVYERLASFVPDAGQLDRMVQSTYPTPDTSGWSLDDPRRVHERDTEIERVRRRRLDALALFQGGATGIASDATWQTAWGFYQAVCELEDRAPGIGKSRETIAHAALFGDRAAAKARAFRVVRELSLN